MRSGETSRSPNQMRKPIGLFVAAFATVAGGGLAVAVEGEPRQSDESTTTSTESTTTSTESTTTSTESTTTSTESTTTSIQVELTEPEDLVEGDGGEHGAWVSDHAQNLCGPDAVNPDTGQPYRNHGECVSRAARDKDHDGTPDVPADADGDDVAEDGEPGAGHRTSGGAGHRPGSRGRGHGRHGG